MQEFLAGLQEQTDKMRLTKPSDVSKLLAKEGPYGSRLTVLSTAKIDISSAVDILGLLYQMVREEDGDLETYRAVIGEYIAYLNGRFKNTYAMADSADIMSQAAALFAGAADQAMMAKLLQGLQLYLQQLSGCVDACFPWDGLAKAQQELTDAGFAI